MLNELAIIMFIMFIIFTFQKIYVTKRDRVTTIIYHRYQRRTHNLTCDALIFPKLMATIELTNYIIFVKKPDSKRHLSWYAAWNFANVCVGVPVRPGNPSGSFFVNEEDYDKNYTKWYSANLQNGRAVPGNVVKDTVMHGHYHFFSYVDPLTNNLRYIICYGKSCDDLLVTAKKYSMGEWKYEQLDCRYEPNGLFPSVERFYHWAAHLSKPCSPEVIEQYSQFFTYTKTYEREKEIVQHDVTMTGFKTVYFGFQRFNLNDDSHIDRFILAFRLAVLQSFRVLHCSKILLYLRKGTIMPEKAIQTILTFVFTHRVRTLPLELPFQEYLEGRLSLHDFVHFPFRILKDGKKTLQPFDRYHRINFLSEVYRVHGITDSLQHMEIPSVLSIGRFVTDLRKVPIEYRPSERRYAEELFKHEVVDLRRERSPSPHPRDRVNKQQRVETQEVEVIDLVSDGE